jgi:hypothetical protein
VTPDLGRQLTEIASTIRSEADIAARPGQYDRLNACATSLMAIALVLTLPPDDGSKA